MSRGPTSFVLPHAEDGFARGRPLYNPSPGTITTRQPPMYSFEEAQSPVAARKSGSDRPRPLDPVPMARLRHAGALDPRQFSCSAELFRIPSPADAAGGGYTYYEARRDTLNQVVLDSNDRPIFDLRRTIHPPLNADIVHCVNTHAVLESAAESHLLYGCNFVDATPHNPGELYFLFPTLGVSQTGHYLLRYTACYKAAGQIFARCYGKPFVVLPADQFPGLSRSTALTEEMAVHNVPGLRIRK